MRVDVVSIFPAYLDALDLSLPGKARAKGLLDLHVHDLRQWTHDRHRTVDDTPYGGGAGMVMKPEPWGEALDALVPGDDAVLVVPTPSGVPFTQRLAAELAREPHLVVACGRYEGIDQRVVDHARTRMRVLEVSVGDYVLNGGEAAALVVLEAVVRLLPGFMGNQESLAEESHGAEGLLEYPVYTKPATWRGLEVPDVLLSGDHARIAAWRRRQAERRTAERRPDLLHASGVVVATELTDRLAAGAVELRPARRADLGELMTLQWACFDPPLREPLDALAEEVLGGTTLVLRVGGRLVGAVSGRPADDGTVWQLSLLMVAPDLRGRGIGTFLLSEGEALAPDGVATFRLRTDAAAAGNLRLYRRAGYSVRGEETVGATGTRVATLTRRRRPRG
ncbi:tRNA (guanosine(37)-N1)-methyltransferase TrmD [Nocardioides caldifontis]|uniref:tRNA (guanosine(37)-N1)-methyltransferase TrmD n=1 Tax=Nocardioides caldifontis TaxID=2588938 RepID=UPI0011DFBF57|nr:tRNA (guanosine(37)-N1)-methyltransferase TrmD [Nocardioides caldifontis]